MSNKKLTALLYIVLLFLVIFTSTATAQTVNQAEILTQVEKTAMVNAIAFNPQVDIGYTTERAGFNITLVVTAFFLYFKHLEKV